MQYMIQFFETEKEVARRDDPAEAGAYWGAWSAYIVELRESGAIVNGSGLMPPHTATRVSVRDGRRHVQDGPHPDTKEHLGGYFIVEVADLDQAIALAAKSPNASAGYTEIRPVLPPMPA